MVTCPREQRKSRLQSEVVENSLASCSIFGGLGRPGNGK